MTLSKNPGRRLRRAAACLAAAAALGACGGGTSQYEAFVPGRLIVFGDENSALTSDGLKYSINATVSVDGSNDKRVDCSAQPIWVQSLAASYGFVFPECNPNNSEATHARMYAAAGARVEDVEVQIVALVASGGFRDQDMATVMAGGNDIVDLYRQYPARSEVDLTNEVRERGRQLARLVNQIVGLGAKVIIATVPDMGLTPYALRQRAEFDDTNRAALLSRLSAAFNEQLGVNVILDGRYVGLVQADLRTQAMARRPRAFGLVNTISAACLGTVELPACNNDTLVEAVPVATAANYLWADDLRLAYGGQRQLASLAIDRSRRNPF